MTTQMTIALILFIFTYILMLSIPKYKSYIAFGVAILFVILGFISVKGAFIEIDYNVLLMILGTMGTVTLFIESKMPSLMADVLIKKSKNAKWMTIYLALFAGIISAFVDNVATVLMIAPVTIELAKKMKISPVPIIISVSIFSNIEGAATLVGDTTSILLAGATNMDFLDFFWYEGKIGLFFIVQAGLIASAIVLYYKMRHHNRKVNCEEVTKVNDYIPTCLLVSTMMTLIVASFIPDKWELTNGVICVSYFIVGLLIELIRKKKFKSLNKYIKEIDFDTLLLLASLFIIIGGIKNVGLIDEIGKLFMNVSNNNEFLMYTLIVFVSVVISAFIDNIPYVATMLPVVSSIAACSTMNPTLLYYGLIVGATLGGNFTPIGASANITAIGILRKNGYSLKAKEYYKYSIPLTLASVLAGYIIIYIIF